MQLGNLSEYWRVVDEEFGELDRLPDLRRQSILSARAFDEAQPAGRRPYIEAQRYLGAAKDNHDALLALLRHHGATPWAPWSLLRPAFETAFLAAWVLDPEDGRERRARGLRCEILDTYEQRRHRDVFKAYPEMRSLIEESERKVEMGSLATYRKEAVALGRKFETLNQKIQVANELRRLSFLAPDTAPMVEGTWRQLSGYEHGLGWAVLSGSDKEVRAQIPGGANMMLIINDDHFVNAAKTTCYLMIMACRTFRRRHNGPGR